MCILLFVAICIRCMGRRVNLHIFVHNSDSEWLYNISVQVQGVKGPSWLAVVPCFEGMATDYMDCVLLGVCRLLFRLWLQSSNYNEVWYVDQWTSDLDAWLGSLTSNLLMKFSEHPGFCTEVSERYGMRVPCNVTISRDNIIVFSPVWMIVD